MQAATKDELQVLPEAWETIGFPSPALIKSSILKEPEFDINKVKGHVKLTKSITIEPFQMIHTSGLTGCKQHFKRVNMMVEPDPHRKYDVVIPIHG